MRVVFKDSNNHTKAVNNNSGYLFGELLGQCVGLISGGQWSRVRSVTEPPFHRSTVSTYVPAVRERTRAFLERLWSEKGKKDEAWLRPADDLKNLPFLITADIVYGTLTTELEAELRALGHRREALFQNIMQGGLSRFAISAYLPWMKGNRDMAAFQSRWKSFNDKAYRSALDRGLTSAPIVTLYSRVGPSGMSKNKGTDKISRTELLHTLDEMLFANLDVTAGALSWNIVFLAAEQAVQGRLRSEISTQLKGDGDETANRDAYVLSSKTLLAACVNESARLRPLAAL